VVGASRSFCGGPSNSTTHFVMCKRNVRFFFNAIVALGQRRGVEWCAPNLTIVAQKTAVTYNVNNDEEKWLCALQT
jgi:hypothetical protein